MNLVLETIGPNLTLEVDQLSLGQLSLSETIYQVAGSGGGSDPAQTSYPAAVPISGGRLVRLAPDGLHYYDATDTAQAYSLLGVSLNAASAGASVTVQTEGAVVHVGWGLTPGAIYLAGSNGLLTTSTSGLAFLQILGRAVDANTLSFSPQVIIFPV